MLTLEDARSHLISLITSIRLDDNPEKLHTLIHSLESVCHCIYTENSLNVIHRPSRGDFPTILDDDQ